MATARTGRLHSRPRRPAPTTGSPATRATCRTQSRRPRPVATPAKPARYLQPPATIPTSQSWTPQDSATVTGGGTGSVTFNLYKNDPTCTSSGAVVYGPDVEPLNISGVASTNNTIFSVSSVGTSGDTYYWG